MHHMAIRKDELYQLIDRLDRQDEKAAFDFLEFLVQRSKKKQLIWRIQIMNHCLHKK